MAGEYEYALNSCDQLKRRSRRQRGHDREGDERSARDEGFIMSAIADMIDISFKADMYFQADMLYNVRYEGHDIAQRRTAWCCHPPEA